MSKPILTTGGGRVLSPRKGMCVAYLRHPLLLGILFILLFIYRGEHCFRAGDAKINEAQSVLSEYHENDRNTYCYGKWAKPGR